MAMARLKKPRSGFAKTSQRKREEQLTAGRPSRTLGPWRAGFVHFATWAILGLSVQALPARAKEAIPAEIPPPEAVGAYKAYWNAFEQYEAGLIKKGKKKFNQSWDDVKQQYSKDQKKISTEQLERLERAIANYKKHLESHPDANNRPYVLLNLAQMQQLLATHLAEQDLAASEYARSEALAALKEIEEHHPSFTYREHALYLRAVVLEDLQRADEALAAWNALAASAKNSIHGVYARVALGDSLFSRDRMAEAAVAYEKAGHLLSAIEVEDPAYEALRINYRLAWAAYRAAELDLAISASVELLRPGLSLRSEAQRERIQQDAIDLIGDALYENNNPARTRAILGRKELTTFAAAIGLRTIARYHTNGVHGEAALLGEHLTREVPLSKVSPDILQVTADAWRDLGKTPQRIASQERLAALLPARSLWRARYRDDKAATSAMEEKARLAAAAVAAHHYETGMASGNNKAFAAAAAHYEILIDDRPNSDEANQWRLRLANCYFFAGDYARASSLYAALKSEYKVDADTLQIASYQLVLSNERRWRESFGKALEKGTDPTKDERTLADLRALERSIDEFAARFPGQSRAVDLLLVAAAANRDVGDFQKASSYWQRTLVSQPDAAQRGVAIRGLVFAAMKIGASSDVVELARRFLKLEDWRSLGLNIGNELRGVLSVAALDEGKRLSDNGKVLEGGALLVDIAREHPDLPDRDRVWRDGSYMLAIGNDWSAAQKASEAYLDEGLTRNRGDMIYLAARAHEYQIRLKPAAQRYFELGRQFPNHPRSAASLTRAEKLALAENDYALAARAAAQQAERAPTAPEKLTHYDRAVAHLEAAGDLRTARELAVQRRRLSRTDDETLRARVMLARIAYKSGSEREALDELQTIARSVERSRLSLKAESYAAIAGETHYLLGEEARQRFEDFRIMERGGTIAANIAQKTRYFEDLVAAYDKAAFAGDRKWSTISRYRLAAAAEAFADEIAGMPARTDEPLNLRAQSRYNATVERLRALTRRYHGANMMAARRDPAHYQGDEWAKKSTLWLTNGKESLPESRHQDMLPTATQEILPSQWSL